MNRSFGFASASPVLNNRTLHISPRPPEAPSVQQRQSLLSPGPSGGEFGTWSDFEGRSGIRACFLPFKLRRCTVFLWVANQCEILYWYRIMFSGISLGFIDINCDLIFLEWLAPCCRVFLTLPTFVLFLWSKNGYYCVHKSYMSYTNSFPTDS